MATVLIIEDDVNMAELLKERLEHKGYNTVVAYSAIKGLKEMNENRPDVITLDIHLPDMSGVDVLKLLKMDKEKAATPIIIVTSDDSVEKTCEEYHADGFLLKPVNFKKLEDLLHDIIKVSIDKDVIKI